MDCLHRPARVSHARCSLVVLLTVLAVAPATKAHAQQVLPYDNPVEVLQIKFDHKDIGGTADGLDIRKDLASDLTHTGRGRGRGEWNRESSPANNEPMLYLEDTKPSIKVRLRNHPNFFAPPPFVPNLRIKSAIMWATATWTSASGRSGTWILEEKEVQFDELTHFSKNGAAPTPQYIEFHFSNRIPMGIDRYDFTFTWMGRDIECYGNVGVVDPATFTLDSTGTHRAYVVLQKPAEPWYRPGIDLHSPSVKALEFAIVTAGAKGKGTVAEAATQLTSYFHTGMGVRYDHVSGASGFTTQQYVLVGVPANPNLPTPSERAPQVLFALEAWIDRKGLHPAGKNVIACYDPAAAVHTFLNLLGGDSSSHHLFNFGYIHPTKFCSDAQLCNNPFFESPEVNPAKLVPVADDATKFDRIAVGAAASLVEKRDLFANHDIVLLAGNVLDATVGPYLGTLSLQLYLDAAVDRSSPREETHDGTANGRRVYALPSDLSAAGRCEFVTEQELRAKWRRLRRPANAAD